MTTQTEANPYQIAILLLFSSLVTFLTIFYNLDGLPYFGSDEPRYARIAEEMVLTGEYITPTLEGKPWLEKTPLLFWIESVSFRLFGFSEWAARFPVALMSLIGAFASAFLASTFQSSRAGLITYLILMTTPIYAIFSRAASTDIPLTAMLTLTIISGFMSLRNQSKAWALLTGIAAGLATLAKGPVTIVLAGSVLTGYVLLSKKSGWTVIQVLSMAFGFIFTAGPWFLLVWLENGENFLITFILNHHVARFISRLHHHSQPIWYYFPIILAGFFPWIFFLGSSIRRIWRKRRELSDEGSHPELFLWLWVLIPFVFFTLSSSKLAGYILPVIPPLAILAGLEWERLFLGELTVYKPTKTGLAFAAAFAIVVGMILIFGFHFKYGALRVGLLVAIPVAISSLWGQFEFRRRRFAALFVVLVGGIALTLAILYQLATPIISTHHSARDLALLAGTRTTEEEPLVFYRYFHHSARYYASYQTTAYSLDSPKALRDYVSRHLQSSYVLLTQKNGWQELKNIPNSTLLKHLGNLYLVEIPPPPQSWKSEELQ